MSEEYELFKRTYLEITPALRAVAQGAKGEAWSLLQRRQNARRRAIDRRLRLMMDYRNQRQNRANLAEGAATTRGEAA